MEVETPSRRTVLKLIAGAIGATLTLPFKSLEASAEEEALTAEPADQELSEKMINEEGLEEISIDQKAKEADYTKHLPEERKSFTIGDKLFSVEEVYSDNIVLRSKSETYPNFDSLKTSESKGSEAYKAIEEYLLQFNKSGEISDIAVMYSITGADKNDTLQIIKYRFNGKITAKTDSEGREMKGFSFYENLPVQKTLLKGDDPVVSMGKCEMAKRWFKKTELRSFNGYLSTFTEKIAELTQPIEDREKSTKTEKAYFRPQEMPKGYKPLSVRD